MTREIKFRVYDQKSKDYTVYGIGEVVDEHFGLGIISRIVWWLEGIKHKFIIEQYTGFKDKNGKEIYEGDIVKAKGEAVINQCIFLDTIAEVVWVPSAAGFGEKFVGKDKPMVPFGSFEYEVIGNIHENPELLGDRA